MKFVIYNHFFCGVILYMEGITL